MAEDFLVNLTWTPRAQQAIAQLAAFPARLLPAIARGLDGALEEALQQTLRTNFTGKGPFPVSEHKLGVRSGLLRTSFLRTPAQIDGSRISAGLGSSTKYWFPHEFGFDGQVSVAAYTRTTARNEKGGVVRMRTALRSKKPHTLRTHTVSTHTRHLRIPMRAPMRTGLTDRTKRMSEVISASAVREWRTGGNGP